MALRAYICCLFLFASHLLSAQSRKEVVVFTPLFLDSAFQQGEWKYRKEFPKQSLNGLEFYHGIKLAIDSLAKIGATLKVTVYDTRNQQQSVGTILRKGALQNVSLIIGYTNGPETKALADEAAKLKIPFVSANFPNDAGVTNNPYFIILNSTLKTHCEGVYEYLQKQKLIRPVLFLTKSGAQEERLKSYLQNISKQTTDAQLQLKTLLLNNEINVDYLARQLDSTATNSVFIGSLDLKFASEILNTLGSLAQTYPIVVYGMPTWAGLSNWDRKEWKGLTIIYTEPFYFNPNNTIVKQITQQFKAKLFARPSELVMRGFDQGFHFMQLLHTKDGPIADYMSEPNHSAISPLYIQPVLDETGNMQLQFFENKHLFFYRYLNGELKVTQ